MLAVAVLALVAAGCDWPNLSPPGSAPVRYRDAIFSSVSVTHDLTYGTATNGSNQQVTLTYDLYTPPATDTDTARAAIVWVHGGSFCCGDKSEADIVDQATVLGEQGYVGMSINYRVEPGGCSAANPTASCVLAIQEATQDAQTAVQFLRANAAKYGVDPTRIAIAGSSAGAITALQVGYASAETPAAAVRAAVSLSGANLLEDVGTGDAPALLFHGTSDPLVPYAWAVSTQSEAAAAGLDAFLETWQGAGHVPYLQFRSQILTQETNFLYWEMDLLHAT